MSLQARASLSPGALGHPSLSSSKSHSSQGQLLICSGSGQKQSKKGRQVLSISKRSEHRYQGVVVATGRKGGSGSGRQGYPSFNMTLAALSYFFMNKMGQHVMSFVLVALPYAGKLSALSLRSGPCIPGSTSEEHVGVSETLGNTRES